MGQLGVGKQRNFLIASTLPKDRPYLRLLSRSGWDDVARRRSAKPLLLPLIAVAVVSCSSSSDVIDQQSKLAASTAQTVALVTDEWIAGTVPAYFTSAALQSFAKALAGSARQLETVKVATRPDGIVAAIKGLAEVTGRAEASIETGKPTEANKARQDLRAWQTDLAAAYASYFAPLR